ncbi:SIR2 family protein [Hymenobacter sp. B81]|uniref:SIR2 family protein n=1 Tax=Hymenobacter sp. B81 TaxID=3344878 RepID=UPI0037DC1A9C
MTREQERFIKEFVAHLFEGDAAIFAGAGLSAGAGYVNWSGLLADIADDLGLHIDRETDLISLAQFHSNARGRSKLNHKILEEFTAEAEETENHRILARLPVATIWTTNYDTLLEDAFKKSGKRPDVKYTVPQLANSLPKRDVTIYKMHGDVNHPNEAIITKDDYENYHRRFQPYVTALSSDLITKTFLFIGFSFTDPNLDYILSRVRMNFEKNFKNHFCFIRRIKLGDKGSEKQADFDYNTRRQQLMLNDLNRFNIQAVMIDDYADITSILAEVERQYKRRTILLSGSAEEYGSYSREEATGFIHKLSGELIKANYTIVNGFGWGVGSAVINGALEVIHKQPGKFSESQLIMRPFPQFETGQQKLPELWHDYRMRMTSYAGVALFIFGNKLEAGQVVAAGGVRKEFDIARQQGLVLLPVGATGYMARELWAAITADYDAYFGAAPAELRPLWEQLGDESQPLMSHITTIKQILTLLNSAR